MKKTFFDNLVSLWSFFRRIISGCVSLSIILTKASLTFLGNFSRLAWQQQDYHALKKWFTTALFGDFVVFFGIWYSHIFSQQLATSSEIFHNSEKTFFKMFPIFQTRLTRVLFLTHNVVHKYTQMIQGNCELQCLSMMCWMNLVNT